MELTSLTLGAAVAAIGSPVADVPTVAVQQYEPALVSSCKIKQTAATFEEVSRVLANAKASASFILDPTVAQPSCQA